MAVTPSKTVSKRTAGEIKTMCKEEATVFSTFSKHKCRCLEFKNSTFVRYVRCAGCVRAGRAYRIFHKYRVCGMGDGTGEEVESLYTCVHADGDGAGRVREGADAAVL